MNLPLALTLPIEVLRKLRFRVFDESRPSLRARALISVAWALGATLATSTAAAATGIPLKAFPIVEPATIVVTPQAPTPGQVIQLLVQTGIVCFPGNDPEGGVEVSINGAEIDITVFTSICVSTGTPPPPYQFTINIGPLAAGAYTINLSYRNRPSIPPDGPIPPFDPPVQLLAQPVVVANAAAIPSVGHLGLVVLILLLSGTGVGLMRRRFRNKQSRHWIAMIALYVLTAYAMPFEVHAAESQPVDAQPDAYTRQLIVLFDPRIISNPSPQEVVAAANNPRVNPDLWTHIPFM